VAEVGVEEGSAGVAEEVISGLKSPTWSGERSEKSGKVKGCEVGEGPLFLSWS